MDKVIVANSDIHEKCSDAWIASIEKSGEDNSIFDIVDNEFIKFKRSAQKEVNYLIKSLSARKQQILMRVLLLHDLVFWIALNYTLTNTMKISSKK